MSYPLVSGLVAIASVYTLIISISMIFINYVFLWPFALFSIISIASAYTIYRIYKKDVSRLLVWTTIVQAFLATLLMVPGVLAVVADSIGLTCSGNSICSEDPLFSYNLRLILLVLMVAIALFSQHKTRYIVMTKEKKNAYNIINTKSALVFITGLALSFMTIFVLVQTNFIEAWANHYVHSQNLPWTSERSISLAAMFLLLSPGALLLAIPCVRLTTYKTRGRQLLVFSGIFIGLLILLAYIFGWYDFLVN